MLLFRSERQQPPKAEQLRTKINLENRQQLRHLSCRLMCHLKDLFASSLWHLFLRDSIHLQHFLKACSELLAYIKRN